LYVKDQSTASAKEALNQASEAGQITLHWVKAHVGIHGNETADAAAKLGALNPQSQVLRTPVPKSYIKRQIRDYTLDLWQKNWNRMDSCRQTKVFMPSVNLARAKSLCSLDRPAFGGAVRWITGHNHLRYQNRNAQTGTQDTDTLCRFCRASEETSGHFITECDYFHKERGDIFKKYRLDPITPDWTPQQLRTFLSLRPVIALEESDDQPD
jgi:ribonuclease HI